MIYLVLDSSGLFIESGSLKGSLTSLGQYDDCLNIKSPIYDNEQFNQIKGKYCLAKLILPMPKHGLYNKSDFQSINYISQLPTSHHHMKLFMYGWSLLSSIDSIYQFGICIPNSCKAEDAEKIFNKCMLQNTNYNSFFFK